MTLLVDFAEANALPVTFWDMASVRYISKASQQVPSPAFGGLTWSTKNDYLDSIRRRIGARALYDVNTVSDLAGPRPGDLMLKRDHAAIVFAVYMPGNMHPLENDNTIPVFPGSQIARTQHRVTRYFRNRGVSLPDQRFDYLNHRGEGGKQAAELIFNASAQEMRVDGFDFRIFQPGVFDNWPDWTGLGLPPR
jgi:hypothetical protein